MADKCCWCVHHAPQPIMSTTGPDLVADRLISRPTNWLTDRYAFHLCYFCIWKPFYLTLKKSSISYHSSLWRKKRFKNWQARTNTKSYFCKYWQWKVKKFLHELFLIIIWLFLARSVCLLTEELKIKRKFNKRRKICLWVEERILYSSDFKVVQNVFRKNSYQFSKGLECAYK